MEKRVSKLNITTDDPEWRENVAKRLNRNAKNRLRQQHEQFEDTHDFIKSKIDLEIKRLQGDLKGIREIRDYDANLRNSQHEMNKHQNLNNTGIKRKRKKKLTLFKKKSNSRRKLNRDDREKNVKFCPEDANSSQIISVEKATAGNDLPRLLPEEKQVKNAYLYEYDASHETRVNKHDVRFGAHELQHEDRKTRLCGHEDGRAVHEKGYRSGESSHMHESLPHITQNSTQESAKSRELDVQEARNQAKKRLLRENDDDSSTQVEQEGTNNDDVESYMYVPPDGRKRTVYLLPPLEDLLQEARKARYLRMPKRLINHEDDPERELSVDEIFSKSL